MLTLIELVPALLFVFLFTGPLLLFLWWSSRPAKHYREIKRSHRRDWLYKRDE